MKAVVRDDIISLNSYVAAEFKYKKYLYMLMKAGNYCFLDQFKKLVPSGQAIIAGMIDNNLVATENINKNYKYVYLTDTAMKYLYLRDSDEDYSKIQKNRISVKKVNKNPSEKQLFSSAYKFHLLFNNDDMIDKESILNELADLIFIESINKTRANYYKWIDKAMEDIKINKQKVDKLISELNSFRYNFIEINDGINLEDLSSENKELRELNKKYYEIRKQIEDKSNSTFKFGLKELNQELENIAREIKYVERIEKIKKQVKRNVNNTINIKRNEIKSKQNEIEEIENKIKNKKELVEEVLSEVAKVSKVFENLYNISKVIARIKNNTLEFIILDVGNFKTAQAYLKEINDIKELNIKFDEINIIIYSYAENRALNLYNEFIKAKRNKERALKSILDYNAKTENNLDKPEFYIIADNIYDSIPDFNIEVKEDCYYMKSYKNLISSSTKSIKRKDKKAINDLIKKLNSK